VNVFANLLEKCVYLKVFLLFLIDFVNDQTIIFLLNFQLLNQLFVFLHKLFVFCLKEIIALHICHLGIAITSVLSFIFYFFQEFIFFLQLIVDRFISEYLFMVHSNNCMAFLSLVY